MAEGLADLEALLAHPERALTVPSEQRQRLLDDLAAYEGRCRQVRALLMAPLFAPERAHGDAPMQAVAEWLSTAEVASWLNCGVRTVRRRMRDGTWRKGEHWFQQGRARPRFQRAALEAWLRAQDQPPSTLGLAYGPDIPRGRRRRLTLLRNKSMRGEHGATTGAEADRAAGRVPGARATDGAARGG